MSVTLNHNGPLGNVEWQLNMVFETSYQEIFISLEMHVLIEAFSFEYIFLISIFTDIGR